MRLVIDTLTAHSVSPAFVYALLEIEGEVDISSSPYPAGYMDFADWLSNIQIMWMNCTRTESI